MKLLDKITKWFFKTTKIEINTDWRLVALDLNRENDKLRKQIKYWMQAYSDQKKINEINEEKSK